MPHYTSSAPDFASIFFNFPEQQQRRTFSPKFDVYETSTSYVLEGELSGLEKSNLNIEFTDPVTLVIKGKIEKSKHIEPESPTPKSGSSSRAPSPTRSLKATVEDEEEEGEEGKKESVVKKQPVVEKKEFKTRQWVNERTIGSFQRTFTFPAGIDQDGVTAGLEFGVLKVVVPKKAPVSRRIEIL